MRQEKMRELNAGQWGPITTPEFGSSTHQFNLRKHIQTMFDKSFSDEFRGFVFVQHVGCCRQIKSTIDNPL